MMSTETSYDVIVVGLGGMGSSAAYHLAARGQRVLGLEKFTPAHDKGSSHGGSRIIRQSYFEDPAYVPLLLRAYELWEKLAADSDREVYRITGGLFSGAPDCLTVAGSLRASRQWDLPHELLSADEITARFPTFAPKPDDVALYEAKAGFARPELTVRAHIDLAERAGADLHFGEPVLEWLEAGEGVRVTTARGTYTAGQLVICPGAWAPQLLAEFGIPITVERQVLYWFDPAGGTPSFEEHPIFIHENPGGEQVYGFPAIDGASGGVKVAFFRKGVECTPETIDRRVGDDEIARCEHASPSCCLRWTGHASTRPPACTPTPPTNTSSSRVTRTAPMSRSPVASRVTDSSSSPSWGRSWPTSPSTV